MYEKNYGRKKYLVEGHPIALRYSAEGLSSYKSYLTILKYAKDRWVALLKEIRMQIRQESYQEHLGTIKGELDIFDNALMDHRIWVCAYEMGTKGQSQVLRRQVYREKSCQIQIKD